MTEYARVAFLPDTFHEVNGVAHTSRHLEAFARRHLLRFLGDGISHGLGTAAEFASLNILRFFYSRADMVMAPNRELIKLTRKLTGKPVFLMERGVDTVLFSAAKRTRSGSHPFRIGYVGRLTAEKNVRFLAEIGHALLARGITNFEFAIVGEGSESAWLRANVPHATLTGVLRGEALAQAYADMDVFAFPTTTDTFGNVILEALASSVPCVVTDRGGPKFLVQQDVTGHITRCNKDFIDAVASLMANSDGHAQMRHAAREYAFRQSWESVFEDVFRAYASYLPQPKPLRSGFPRFNLSAGATTARPGNRR